MFRNNQLWGYLSFDLELYGIFSRLLQGIWDTGTSLYEPLFIYLSQNLNQSILLPVDLSKILLEE